MSSDGAKLVRAASNGDAAKVKRLLKAKVDVNHGDKGEEGSSGITALQEACMSGHVGVVRLLLKAKAAVDLRDSDGCTALYGASQNAQVKCAQLLLEALATVDLKANDGSTPLSMSCQTAVLESARLLLRAKANVDEAPARSRPSRGGGAAARRRWRRCGVGGGWARKRSGAGESPSSGSVIEQLVRREVYARCVTRIGSSERKGLGRFDASRVSVRSGRRPRQYNCNRSRRRAACVDLARRAACVDRAAPRGDQEAGPRGDQEPYAGLYEKDQ